MNEEQLKNFFRHNGLKPKDYLGQNFLVDLDVLNEIIEVANLKKTDTVLEVGPGLGVLTKELSKHAKEIVAVEKDEKIIPLLEKEIGDRKNVKIIHQDILRFNPKENFSGSYKLVANIPYYLTSKLIQNFLESNHPPTLMVLMIQKEVGERIVAAAGDLSILGISVQIYADASIEAFVPRISFWPAPEVDSVIIKIVPRNKYPKILDLKLFFRIIKMAFAGKRKQILNSLTNGLKEPKEKVNEYLIHAKIDSHMRPQDLTIEDWIRLYEVIAGK